MTPTTTPKPTPTSRSRRRRLFLAVLGTALALAPALVGSAPLVAASASGAFEFDTLNRSYSMDGSELAPVRQGPLTIHLSSPSNLLRIESHSVQLVPLSDGSYRVKVGASFLGKGDLVADVVTDTGTSSRLEDEVVLPRQSVEVNARVRFARVPGGWDVTALELPASVPLEVRSQLFNSIVTLCDQLGLFLGLDCTSLDRSLSRIQVPLPEAGTVFFLSEDDLGLASTVLLERYLGASDDR